MRKLMMTVAILVSVGATMMGCQSPPKTEAGRAKLDENTTSVLDRLYSTDPGFKRFLDRAYGYAVFPTAGKGGLIVGGAYGHGEVFEQGMKIGYAEITQATVGAQIGGQQFTEVIAFENKNAMEKFKAGKFAFSAQVSAVALKSGASENAKYADGVAVFTATRGGLMAEAAIGGQKFAYQSLENAGK